MAAKWATAPEGLGATAPSTEQGVAACGADAQACVRAAALGAVGLCA